jgi:DNA polymerase-3 subunit alpha
MPDFIHLHTHSDFSLLDGAASISSLLSKAVEYKMSHLALTDHGNMFGALKFYKDCKALGIIPIIGSEFYLAPKSRFHKAARTKDPKYSHIVLLAKNTKGYKNLLKLSSYGYTEGFYYKPRIDHELIETYSEDLVCLSACLAGEIPSLILNNRIDEAEQRALYYRDIFGNENFFLELQDHGIPEQKRVNEELISISKKSGIPLVATNDIHYTEKSDARAQDVLICIGTNKKITDGKRLKFQFPEFYFKSQEEMASLFKDVPEALKNTIKIGEMCSVDIPLTGPILPDYEVPSGYTVESYLSHLSNEGLKKRYSQITDDIRDRLNYELSVITKMGFAGYFLIVWDFIKFAKDNKIPVGPGRGSGAGSLTAYALEITDVDPLRYGLLFERFLNPERVSMPDFDIDFCFEKRSRVIDYVTNKYGKEKVGQIITFGTLKAKAAIRDVARVLDYPYAEADRIAKLIPSGPKISLAKAFELEPKLAELEKENEKNRELMDISRRLHGLARHASTHAAGIVIGKEELSKYVPLYKDPKTGSISTQFTMNFLEESGLVKMDLLGLKNLTIIDKTCKMIRDKEIDFDILKIPDNDRKTFDMLGRGESTCVFQFESQGMQGILKRAKPDKIEDLIALNALYRPGPMEHIDQFIESKNGKREIVYPFPELEPVLKETYGVIIYQEQVMQIARKVAGFTLAQADILRRAMGKKKIMVMAKQRELFLSGASKNGYSREDAERIFDLLIPFAGYGFNKSHATAYSILAYQTAYLKANYPAFFMAAYLTSEMHDTDKLAQHMTEAREMGLKILPPDINLSSIDFTVVEGNIVYGLGGIKNVGTTATKNIITEREENGLYKSLFNFLERIDLRVNNRKVLEALILAGVMDKFGENRATLFHNLDRLMEWAGKTKENKAYGQIPLFDSTQMEELSKIDLEEVEEWPRIELLRLEKQNLGFYFSGHPLDNYRELITRHTDLDLGRLEKVNGSRDYTLIGIVKNIKMIITKRGRKMAFALLEDFKGAIELVIFSDPFEQYQSFLEEDNIIAVQGHTDNSRDTDIKFIVEKITNPHKLPEKEAREVHIRLRDSLIDEKSLNHLKDFVLDKQGKCILYFHISDNFLKKEQIIRNPNLRISAQAEVLERLREYPAVVKVWKK